MRKKNWIGLFIAVIVSLAFSATNARGDSPAAAAAAAITYAYSNADGLFVVNDASGDPNVICLFPPSKVEEPTDQELRKFSVKKRGTNEIDGHSVVDYEPTGSGGKALYLAFTKSSTGTAHVTLPTGSNSYPVHKMWYSKDGSENSWKRWYTKTGTRRVQYEPAVAAPEGVAGTEGGAY